jgi:quercetin dioxygenase-like cupin family protein
MIFQVSEEITIKEGFHQAFYKEEDFEILMSQMNKGVMLDKHKHEHKQFAFCFDGKVNFIVENKEYILEKNMSCLIKEDLEHFASSDEDFYVLDFKYIDSSEVELSPLRKIIPNREIDICDLTLANHKLFKITSQTEMASINLEKNTDFDYYLVVGKQTKILNVGSEMDLYPMKIYKVDGNSNDELELKIKNSNEELHIIQICRGIDSYDF